VTTAAKHRVLVTGSAGRIGQAVVDALFARGHFVRGFDLVPTPRASDSIVGNIANNEAIISASRGTDTIIHLGAVPDDDDFLTKLLPNNIVPIHHILEAARLNGNQRVILASTGQLNWYQQFDGPYPIRVNDPLEPRYWYAAAKVFAEYAGKAYAMKHKIDVIAARLGACPRDRALLDYIGESEIVRDVYLSPGDAGRFFTCAVEAAGGFGFQVVYACSKWIQREVFDLEPARRLLGFEPRDRWPEGIPPEIIGDKPIPGAP